MTMYLEDDFAGHKDRGAATAETAVAMPLLMGLILLIVQFGMWAHTLHVAHATAAEALAAARLEDGSTAAGQRRAQQVRAQIGRRLLANATITVTRGVDLAQVEITTAAPRVIPLPIGGFPVHVKVSGPVEHFRPDTGQRR
jgi:Flp pilus assembly protein TadG